jgi:hypothetical protein
VLFSAAFFFNIKFRASLQGRVTFVQCGFG